MTFHTRSCTAVLVLLSLGGVLQSPCLAADPRLELRRGDHICSIGNTLADRMQHHGWTETSIQLLHPKLELSFRNLGFPGDEVKSRTRSADFGSQDEWLTRTQADVVFCFFGYNEALRGESHLPEFKNDLGGMVDGMLAQKYNGKTAPRLVVFSPIAHEDLRSPHLPDGRANNKSLALYTRAMREVCKSRDILFVDLFTPTRKLYQQVDKPLTMNGIHLLDHGNRALARIIVDALFPGTIAPAKNKAEIARLREAVLDKNYHWFSRYRVVDGYNVYGGRSRLAWNDQSNADVMRREMEMFDIKTANRDRRVWAVADGGDLEFDDENLPEDLIVKKNDQSLTQGRNPYLSGAESIAKMKVAEGMKVNLFASEAMFPEMVNPVQMAVDTDGRLFAAVWPSYPHWNPNEPRTDRIVCLPDEDGDGVADKCIIFADKLNSVTGFEFWGGGMLVAALPEIWFLQDTDGDDRADHRIRMLQGVTSADTHHSANALVMGPGGWLYWSRGIFNTASIETPTKTYRSTQSGVHRFNPRTFEMEFHFPIGPNPHGDVFDQWGYQFVNDGTSGTGSYANIGKGTGYKKWFRKRVRPVAATGILSSSHFPERNNGNFLICNTIGVLGVLQHKVKYDGADISAVEIEPIVLSTDPNFRPTDVEIAGDGALYISDWCNMLIGHMQHNMRDPNRDHKHGRIYRVTARGRPTLKPVKMKGKPIEEVCQAFFARENTTRYHARLELSGRDSKQVAATVSGWAAKLSPGQTDEAQALLECLWVFEEHRMPNSSLLKKVFRAEEPRVRAAAIRTLGHWGERVADGIPILVAASRDESPLVRAEVAKAAVSFQGLMAAEAIFEIARRRRDPEIDHVLKYAEGKINVDKVVADALKSGAQLSVAAQTYVLRNASVEDLLKLDRSEAVYRAILGRDKVPARHLRDSLNGLASIRRVNRSELLLELIEDLIAAGETDSLEGLGGLLTEQPRADLQRVSTSIESLATRGEAAQTRRLGYLAWIASDRSGDDAFLAAVQSKSSLEDFLGAVPSVSDDELRSGLYDKVRPLIAQLPTNIQAETSGPDLQKPGIKVDYFYPSPANVAVETLAKMKPRSSGIVPEIVIDVPQQEHADKFALRFTGMIQIPRSGKYTFYTNSDDGSRLYIARRQVVNNDGVHGMAEKQGSIDLSAGSHPITVTYFDNGGSHKLQVTWKGPGFKKQKLPAERLAINGAETLRDVAIRALTSIPGHEKEKFLALVELVKAGKSRASAINALGKIAPEHRARQEIRPLVDNLVGFLSETPARYRTTAPALDAIALAKSLASHLPAARAEALEARLENLNVRVIAIGTVAHRMIFDKERIVVQAGKPVEFRFSNSDEMPHNFALTKPGALEEVGLLGEATAQDPDAQARHYIPRSDKILLASRLLEPGQSQALSFEAPRTVGVYPYVCTYPGHWRRMYGALYVVANLEEYMADRNAYLAANPLPLEDELLEFNTRDREWKFADLIGEVSPLPGGRSFEVGKQLFKVASCVSCHRLNDEGQVFGPDLALLDEKKRTTEHILRSLLEPARDIEEKYQSHIFVLRTGQVPVGMVVEETADVVKIVIDPIAKGKPTAIQKSAILQRARAANSIMPEGLLNRLSREEILDLVAYIHARGDTSHKLFQTHKHH